MYECVFDHKLRPTNIAARPFPKQEWGGKGREGGSSHQNYCNSYEEMGQRTLMKMRTRDWLVYCAREIISGGKRSGGGRDARDYVVGARNCIYTELDQWFSACGT